MKTTITLFSTILMITLFLAPKVSIAGSDAEKTKISENITDEKIHLFNGKDLGNWEFFLRNSEIDPTTIFTVQDGVIHMFPNPWGYMRTKDSFSNYKLHVEWRWPVVATNSGVFVHFQPRDSTSYTWLEVNLIAGGAGDFICSRGVDFDERIDKTTPFVYKMAESSEKDVGEWNTMEIICKGNTIEVFVNGVLQNKATNLTLDKGSICLQCEGQEVQFRNVYLTKL